MGARRGEAVLGEGRGYSSAAGQHPALSLSSLFLYEDGTACFRGWLQLVRLVIAVEWGRGRAEKVGIE